VQTGVNKPKGKLIDSLKASETSPDSMLFAVIFHFVNINVKLIPEFV